MITRRRFLGSSIAMAATVAAGPARAIGDRTKLHFGQLVLGSRWNPRPTALTRLAWELHKRTSTDVALEPIQVKLSKANLARTPYLYLAGDREFKLPTTAEIDQLRRFVNFGGFIHIDSAEGTIGGAFDASVRRLVRALFPAQRKPMQIVSTKHVVYRSYYRLERPLGRLAISPSMEAVTVGKRIAIAYTQNDLGGAWARDELGNYMLTCEPGGERQRELAMRMGINLAMYALCLDYKDDQVHVDYLLTKRRWRPSTFDNADGPSK